MKKNILFVFIFLLSMITFASCSQDDDDGGGKETIEINGIKYSSGYESLMGIWDEESKSGTVTVSVQFLKNEIIEVYLYKFAFENALCPKVGDDLSGMKLKLYASDNVHSLSDSPLSYVSGSAKVVGVNKGKSEITIKYDQLKMTGRSSDYTFNGTATSLFTEEWK